MTNARLPRRAHKLYVSRTEYAEARPAALPAPQDAGAYQRARNEAAIAANREDASLWRWFCSTYEEGRIRWCRSGPDWLVSVDHRHVATEPDFDMAIRVAFERRPAA